MADHQLSCLMASGPGKLADFYYFLLQVYKDLLPGMGRTISSGSSIDPDRFKTILATLARDEEASFQRRAVRTPAHDSVLCSPCLLLT